MVFWMKVIKREIAHWSLAVNFIFSCVSLALLFSPKKWKWGGQRPPTSPPPSLTHQRSLIPRVPLPFLHRSTVKKEDPLLRLYEHPLSSISTRAHSRTPSFSPVNIQIYILPCGAFHSVSRLLSLSHHSPISCSLPRLLFQSPSLSFFLFSSQDPSHCWMAALLVSLCSKGKYLNLDTTLHSFTIC